MPLYSGNDKAARQEQWLANKTPEEVEKWIRNPENYTFVSLDEDDENGNVTGIVMGSKAGTVLLLYILPEMRKQGLGLQLYQRLEGALIAQDVRHLTLDSTIAAKSFYEGRGYKPRSDVKNDDPLCTPMERSA